MAPAVSERHHAPVPIDYFGEDVATRYDSDEALMFEPAVLSPTVDFLADVAGEGPALELGIGTGRIALPLSQRGVRVHGIDLSSAMVAQLREKAGADGIGVTLGDFATTKVAGSFTLAHLVFNTICNLTTQDEQVECFCNVASHLEPGGCFVIEVEIPSVLRLQPGETFVTSEVSRRHLCIDEYDIAAQGLISHHYYRRANGTFDYLSGPFRYVWPSELDLMARIAGMTLRERWSDWSRAPFTSRSAMHVSVWEKSA